MRSLGLLAAAAMGAGWLGWLAARDPQIPWLAQRSPAAWILYPTARSSSALPAIELDAAFRRRFVLPQRPRAARLEVRCFDQCQVAVNGTPLSLALPPLAPLPLSRLPFAPPTATAAATWKEPRAADLAPLLRAGANVILVRVENDAGPPALWLSLVADGRLLASDTTWEASLAGASWRPGRLATTPMSRWSTGGAPSAGANPRPAAAAAAVLPLLLAFAALTATVIWFAGAFAVHLRAHRPGRPGRPPTAPLVLVAIAAVLWAALLWNNRGLDGAWGFDSEGHLDYLRAVLEQGRLPLADEGWEMYQPPLYYLGAAALLRLAGHAHVDSSAVGLLRAFNGCAFLLQSAFLLASLRVIFPHAPRRWLGGFCLGVFLPAQLYLLHYVTNEVWAAALSSAAIYLCLRCLRFLEPEPRQPWLSVGGDPERLAGVADGDPERWPGTANPPLAPFGGGDPERRAGIDRERWPGTANPPLAPFLLLGALLGLAMLTKFSALVTLAMVAAVLAGRLAVRGVRAPRAYLRSLGSVLLGCLLLCGWHYARVAAHFHHFLVGNWDLASGFAWWQQPGYHTRLDLVRGGEALRAPLLSAFHSIPDALYSTLWGDGMLGGSGSLAVRPPWNYGLMAAGYLLALLPTAAIALGLGAALRRLVRQPRAAALLLVGVLGATALAVLAMCLRVASFAQPKAFYGLTALVPLCAFGGWGLDMIAGTGRRLGPPRRAAGGRAGGAGRHCRRFGFLRPLVAYVLFGVWACNVYATFWIRQPDPGPLRATAAALDPAGLLARARAAGPTPQATLWLRRAVAANPDHPFAWLLLGAALTREGKLDEAVSSWREALRVDAYSAPAHLYLGRVLSVSGHAQEALYHLHLAARLQAVSPAAEPRAGR